MALLLLVVGIIIFCGWMSKESEEFTDYMLEELLEPSKIKIGTKSKNDKEKKVSDIISQGINFDAEIGIIGIPFDVGVELSKGRTGARLAPDKIREQINNYGTTFNIDYYTDLSGLNIADFGNIIVEPNDQDETYDRIKKTINVLARGNIIPLVLGGGHDITYPCIKGFAQYFQSIGGINIDVHFDVREQDGDNISSGMGFRKILEDLKNKPLIGKNFVEIGADGNVNSKKYFNYLKKRDASIFPIKMIRDSLNQNRDIEYFMQKVIKLAEKKTKAVFASLDIDSVSSDAAPGCSFTNPNGFSTDEISRIAHAAGYHEKVKYFDIVEVNPRFDVDNRTSRLCARIISCFLTGYVQRKEKLLNAN